LPGFSQLRAAGAAAPEQGDAQLRFQPIELVRYRRCRPAERAAGRGQPAMVDNGGQHGQLIKGGGADHSKNLKSWHDIIMVCLKSQRAYQHCQQAIPAH
jgi:hypothetical protein